jgi:hypothetical protein
MIIVKLKSNKTLTADYWKDQAKGIKDEYGNPFRIIRLRWINTREHRNTEYSKTRGFEDAIINKGGDEGFKITYRKNGSIMWQRPPGNVGPFYGEVAYTPYNIEKLSAMYGDRLFTIADADIDAICKAKYEERVKNMGDAARNFNKKRIAAMHTMYVETDIKAPEVSNIDKKGIEDQNRDIVIEKRELEIKRLELEEREKRLNEKEARMAGEGLSPVQYSKEYLIGLKLHELKKVAKENGIDIEKTSTKDELVNAIVMVQSGVMNIKPVVEGDKTEKDSLDA